MGAIAAAAIFAIGAVVAGVAWWQEKMTADDLRAANLRLDRKIALRVAPAGDKPYFVGSNWYQIASDYSGAIAIVEIKADSMAIASGFLVRGSALYAPWGEEIVFVTAYHVINSKSLDVRLDEAQASFPGLEVTSSPIKFESILWEGGYDDENKLLRSYDVTILRISGPLPFGAKPIDNVRTEEFEGLTDLDPYKPPNPSQVSHKSSVHLAMIGFGGVGNSEDEEKTGFALFLYNLVGVASRDSDGRAFLAYTDAGQGGTSGSPVFDVETGELVAVHHMKLPNGFGAGISIPSVIAAIKKDLGPPSKSAATQPQR
jgi:Trypsin-like peptidase domain